jgi:hypothetical protein
MHRGVQWPNPTLIWPDGKLICCTFRVAYEAFRKSGRFKKSSKIAVIPKLNSANDWRAWSGGLGNASTYFEGFKTSFGFVYHLGVPYPQTGPGAKPVAPVLFCISKDSQDHSPDVFREVVALMFATINPAPNLRVTQWGGGVHTYRKSEPGLLLGIAPPVAEFYVRAIREGYFVG